MTTKEAIKIIQMERDHCATHNRDEGMSEEYHKEMQNLVDAYDLAMKALEIVDDVNHKVYRNENCSRKGKCYDYIGYHCAGCNADQGKVVPDAKDGWRYDNEIR